MDSSRGVVLGSGSGEKSLEELFSLGELLSCAAARGQLGGSCEGDTSLSDMVQEPLGGGEDREKGWMDVLVEQSSGWGLVGVCRRIG